MIIIIFLIIPIFVILAIIYGIYYFNLKRRYKQIDYQREELMAKRFILGLGITIILPMLVYYGVSTFVRRPEWQDYEIKNYYEIHKRASVEEQERLEQEKTKNDKAYDTALRSWNRINFLVEVPVGISALIIGTLTTVPGFSGGLMLGGIVTAIMGYCWEWAALPNWSKFITLLIIFVIMFWIGYKKLSKKPEGI